MRVSRTRVLVEIALTIALAAVLKRFVVLQMPFGGSISLEMLPIIVLGLRRGVPAGVAAGALFGFVDYVMEPFFVHWAQLFLDYPIAFAAVGLAGAARPLLRRGLTSSSPWRSIYAAGAAVLGTLIGSTARFAAHFLSGIVFFAANAPAGQPVWIYSVVYNATYLVPSAIACAALAAVIVPLLETAVPAATVEAR